MVEGLEMCLAAVLPGSVTCHQSPGPATEAGLCCQRCRDPRGSAGGPCCAEHRVPPWGCSRLEAKAKQLQ